MKKPDVPRLTLSALFMALGFVLPVLTMQIPEVGGMLLPMHLPVLLCGFLCGWPYGLLIGFVTPLLRSLLLGMPPFMPVAVAMAFELAAYGGVTGLLYAVLPAAGKMSVISRPRLYPAFGIFISLLGAMLLGRLVWGLISWLLYALFMPDAFSLFLFWMGAFVRAWPGIALQWVLVPPAVYALHRAGFIPLKNR